ncbi:MAG: hypothetical protein ACR2M0_10760 [Chloroflexia bacterium]
MDRASVLLVLIVDNDMDAARARQAAALASAAPTTLLARGAMGVSLPAIPAEARRIYDRYLAAGRRLVTVPSDPAKLPALRAAMETAGAYGARTFVQRDVAPAPGIGMQSRGLDIAPPGDRGIGSSTDEFRSGGEASRGAAAPRSARPSTSPLSGLLRWTRR